MKAVGMELLDNLQHHYALDPTCVNRQDERGHLPLQWAALYNRVEESKLLIDAGALINATDSMLQTALHWASMRGAVQVVEILLRNNANPELKDSSGQTAMHIAAQYGQTAVIYLMALKWNVDIDACDNDGRTPLHWAACKGYADTVRVLLAFDASCNVADNAGCTSLHWAAMKGNREACRILYQGGCASVLTQQDCTGHTPVQLALAEGHDEVVHYLTKLQSRQAGGWFGKNGSLAWLTSMQLCPLIWLYILALLGAFIHQVMDGQLDVAGRGPVAIWSWSVILCVALGLLFLYKTTTADPGFIPSGLSTHHMNSGRNEGDKNGETTRLLGNPGYIPTGLDTHSRRDDSAGAKDEESTRLLGNQHKALDSPALWAGNWHQLCVSCRIVRPLRAKHCSVTDRCIEVYDHYCPWVGNAVGKGNRHFFLMFLWLELYAIIASTVLGILKIAKLMFMARFSITTVTLLAGFVAIDAMVGVVVSVLAVSQAYQSIRNVTTNELENWRRYDYLRAADGSFHNAFSRGCHANCMEVCMPGSVPMAPVYLPRGSTWPPSTSMKNELELSLLRSDVLV